MSAINLFILGFFMEKEFSAYEVAEFIRKNHIGNLIKISRPAIFKNCLKLAKSGYLESRVVKTGEYPEKTVYSITEKGKKHHHDLMEKIAKEPIPFYFDFNTVLSNLLFVNRDDRALLVGRIKTELEKQEMRYEQYLAGHPSFHMAVGALINQHRILNSALLEWFGDFETSVKEYL